MNILIFASKFVGFKIIEYLLKEHSDDSYEFVLTEDNDEKLIELLTSHKKGFCTVSEFYDRINENDNYDWILNLWGGHIIKKNILSKAKNSLNIHPSILPFAKGKDPVVWTIRNNLPAGVTLHEITEKIDSGNIFYQEKIDYTHPIKGHELYEQILSLSIDVFVKKWSEIRAYPLLQNIDDVDNNFFSRKDLIKDQTKDFFDKSINNTLLWILSHDFSKNSKIGKKNYTAQIKVNGKIYSITIDLVENN